MHLRNLAAKVWEAVVGTVACAVGVVHGALEAAWDTLMAIPDLVKPVWKVLKSFLTLDIFDDVPKLWDTLKGIDWRQALQNIAGEFPPTNGNAARLGGPLVRHIPSGAVHPRHMI